MKHFKQLEVVQSVASSGKFYRLSPDKENNALGYTSLI